MRGLPIGKCAAFLIQATEDSISVKMDMKERRCFLPNHETPRFDEREDGHERASLLNQFLG